MNRVLIGLLIAAIAYSATTTWWILGEADRVQDAERKALDHYAGIQKATFEEGEKAREEVHRIFYPIKEDLKMASCDMLLGVDFRVQPALEKATAAANSGGLPATRDTSGSNPSGRDR